MNVPGSDRRCLLSEAMLCAPSGNEPAQLCPSLSFPHSFVLMSTPTYNDYYEGGCILFMSVYTEPEEDSWYIINVC